MTQNNDDVTLRKPRTTDAAAVWNLIRNCPPLDVNSSYLYLLFCDHFRDTCVVAVRQEFVVGFVSAYQPPGKDDTLFVWQVAVAEAGRGLGLGRRMILEILSRKECRPITKLEATVAPSNTASRKMFSHVARALHAEYGEVPHYEADLLGETGHEDEHLISIGPITAVKKT